MRKIWDIHGGVHPPENKTQSNQTPVADIPLPSQVILPLNQHIGAEAVPVVNVGDTVKTGQLIAKAEGIFSASVHATISGTVSAIEQRLIAHASGMTAPCIVIDNDGKDEPVPYQGINDYHQCSHEELVEKIRSAGIAGMGGAGFPTAVKLNPNSGYDIDTLILNGTECEPYITADDMLMREQADKIVKGAELLAFVLNSPKNIIIGIEDNKPEAAACVTAAAKGTNVEVVTFPTKYPSGGEKQLIQILTGKEVESGKLPAQLGIVLQNVGTAVAAWEAINEGKPLIERITTVVGEALDTQQNIRVRIGTPINHILQHHGFHAEKSARLIIGGPMMGFAIEQTEVPVTKTTNCILVPSKNEMPEPPPAQACIRCGHCAEACPANLLPQQLYWYAQAEDTEKLEAHNLFDCIECGACSYVCPSAIPLVQYYRAAKGTIRQLNAEKQKADRARERFEQRQERIAKAEAEKEAKRLKRKQAAEEAKKKLANTPKPEAAAQAVKPEKAASDDPAKTLSKLERALSSAKNRMDRVQTQLAAAKEENDQARIDKMLAQEKQAQLKIDQAQEKLDAFKKPASDSSATSNDAVAKLINDKLSVSPLEKQQKTIETLHKRLATAKEKLLEAEQEGKPTVDALKQGLVKLEEKLKSAEKALTDIQDQPTADTASVKPEEKSAADIAIEKAKAKAAAAAQMTPEEKHKAQIESVKNRLDKARVRLQKAIDENNENVDAFKTGVDKLETKLAELEQAEVHS